MTLGIARETTVAINNLNGYQLVSMPILFFMNERDMRGPNRNRNTFVPEPGLRCGGLFDLRDSTLIIPEKPGSCSYTITMVSATAVQSGGLPPPLVSKLVNMCAGHIAAP